MWRELKSACLLLLLLTLLTGAVYPLLLTLIAQSVFPEQANGSLLHNAQGDVIGSQLIGQHFNAAQYFWGRPSATSPYGYNAAASSGSNLGPSNPVLVQAVASRIQALKAVDPDNPLPIPVDLVTASGSGLDPHISLAAAQYQLQRVAKARQLSTNQVQAVIDAHREERQWAVLGEPRVNVLTLNPALDRME